MDENNLLPFQLLFYEGLIGFILCCGLLLILSNISCPIQFLCDLNGNMENLKELFDEKEIIFLVIWTLCSAWFNLFSQYSNFYLTPTHRTISDTLSTFALWIYMSVKGIEHSEKGFHLFTTIIGYIILICIMK